AESRVATWLAEGKTVTEIAADTGRQRRSVYWLLEQIYAKLGVRRQVDLVRLVLSVTEFA
ncbi:MAG: DNA-binding response regulator, partial [Holophagales bacterium]|nr:DNA-binding response regulator [Holophagales bacterium]